MKHLLLLFTFHLSLFTLACAQTTGQWVFTKKAADGYDKHNITGASNSLFGQGADGSLVMRSTTTIGLSILNGADAATIRGIIGAGTSSFDGAFSSLTGKPTTLAGYGITDAQPHDADLDAIAALTTTAYGRSLLTVADFAAAGVVLGITDAAYLETSFGVGSNADSGKLVKYNASGQLYARYLLCLQSGSNVGGRFGPDYLAFTNASNVGWFLQPPTDFGAGYTMRAPNASGTVVLDDNAATLNAKSMSGTSNTFTNMKVEMVIAISDESTALTTGTGKVTFRMPYAMTLTAVRATVGVAPTGSTIIVDINESGSTIMTTNKLSIDASEKASTTAATQPGITDSALADDAEITIDIDQIGSTIAGAGLKITLIGTR